MIQIMIPIRAVPCRNWKDISANGQTIYMDGSRASLFWKMALCHITKGKRALFTWPNHVICIFILWNWHCSKYFYCSEFESDHGCRGVISLDKATIKVCYHQIYCWKKCCCWQFSIFSFLIVLIFVFVLQSHEFDECRFDVSVNNCVWYLRAENPEDKTNWVDVLQSYKVPVGIDMSALIRQGSTASLQSNSILFTQNSGNGGLREKINEIETFRDILTGQINQLQR